VQLRNFLSTEEAKVRRDRGENQIHEGESTRQLSGLRRYLVQNSVSVSHHYKLPLVLKIEIDGSIRALGCGFPGGGRFRTEDSKPDVAETDRSRSTQQYAEENARRVGGYVENHVVTFPIRRSK